MFGESLLYFTTTKLLTIKNKRVGLCNTLIQMCILSYIFWDLIHHELYKKVEIPSGYTAFWTENGNLTKIQQETNIIDTIFCQNDTYNYAYDPTEWVYSNISCTKLPYAEMYEKGETEFFFLTHFTEYDINVKNCENQTHKCLTSTNQDFFTIGTEGMLLAFDHFYTTTFEQGSNLGNEGLKLIDTYIKDTDGKVVKFIPSGETVKLYVADWLQYSHVSLDDLNLGTPISVPHPYIKELGLPYNRLSGVEIIIKVNYHNIKYFSGYNSPTCEINVQPNSGWSSKGSLINYITYPNVSDVNDEYQYIDRYRYGIKFKFIVSGLMGEFDINSLITHLVSGIVLVNMSTVIVSLFLMYFSGDYGKYYSKLRYTKTSINVPCFKKCSKISDTEENIADIDDIDDIDDDFDNVNQVLRRRTKRHIKTGLEDRYHEDVYLDSETSYNYSSAEEEPSYEKNNTNIIPTNENINTQVSKNNTENTNNPDTIKNKTQVYKNGSLDNGDNTERIIMASII